MTDRGRPRYTTPDNSDGGNSNRSTPLWFPPESPPTRRSSSSHHSSASRHSSPITSTSSNHSKRARSRSPSNAPPRKRPEARHDQTSASSATNERHNKTTSASATRDTQTASASATRNTQTASATRDTQTASASATCDTQTTPPSLELKPLRWLNDQAPTGRPKAHDYDHGICQLIVKSCHEFSARVCTKDALPNAELQITWSREIWVAACAVVDENYECSDRVIGLVSRYPLYNSVLTLCLAFDRSRREAAMPARLLKMLFDPRSVHILASFTLRKPQARSPLATGRYARICWRTMLSTTRYAVYSRINSTLT